MPSPASPAAGSIGRSASSTRTRATRRDELLRLARATYLDATLEPADAADALLEAARARGAVAKARAEEELEEMDLPPREAEQRVRRVAARGGA